MGEQGAYGAAAFFFGMFGIVMPLPAFAGGMVVALGCCFAVMAMRPPEKRRALALTLFMGTLAGIIAAMLHNTTSNLWLWGALPMQAQMGLAGAMSQAIFELVAARGGAVLNSAADRVLPGAEGE